MSEVERWISLEDIAAHLDVSKDTISPNYSCSLVRDTDLRREK